MDLKGRKSEMARRIATGFYDFENDNKRFRSDLKSVNYNLSELNLGGASLRHADLSGVRPHGTNLGGSNLGYARLNGASLEIANLGGANLGYADLSGAMMRGVNASGVYFGYARMNKAGLVDSYLWGSFLRGCDLRMADISRAHLRGSDLKGADLRGTKFEGADMHGSSIVGVRIAKKSAGSLLAAAGIIDNDDVVRADSDVILERCRRLGMRFS